MKGQNLVSFQMTETDARLALHSAVFTTVMDGTPRLPPTSVPMYHIEGVHQGDLKWETLTWHLTMKGGMSTGGGTSAIENVQAGTGLARETSRRTTIEILIEGSSGKRNPTMDETGRSNDTEIHMPVQDEVFHPGEVWPESIFTVIQTKSHTLYRWATQTIPVTSKATPISWISIS